MFTRGLSAQTQNNLAALKNVSFVSRYYLAGGTALSLYFGHRYSNDLDFFSQKPTKSSIIVSFLKNIGKLEVIQNDEGTFNSFLNEVKLSFFLYPYNLLMPTNNFNDIQIASIDDIACMKIDAISSRGTKRDFIDLYKICVSHKSLKELLKLFNKKYADVRYNSLHILKSLIYFLDAETDQMPTMIEDIKWNEVKKYFGEQVKSLTF